MAKVGSFLKNNFIFVIAFVVALISCFFVPPDASYASYFEINTLACIFLLLLVIAGLSRIQFFEKVARIIVKKFKNTRSIIMCLIFVTYVSAMVNANDMSLPSFIPNLIESKICPHVRATGCGSYNYANLASGASGASIIMVKTPWDYVPGEYLVQQAGGVGFIIGNKRIFANTKENLKKLKKI